MNYIRRNRTIYEELAIDVERSLRDEEVAGPFDDEWIEELHAKQFIIKDLKHILQEHDFWVEQHNR